MMAPLCTSFNVLTEEDWFHLEHKLYQHLLNNFLNYETQTQPFSNNWKNCEWDKPFLYMNDKF